jgi:hypothetical protein
VPLGLELAIVGGFSAVALAAASRRFSRTG